MTLQVFLLAIELHVHFFNIANILTDIVKMNV